MKSEIRQRWLEALRSGKYDQGKSWLRQGDSFCCLGVLCDLVDPTGWRPGALVYSYSVADHTSILPGMTKVATGLDSAVDLDKLMSMNDNGQSFAQIADWIEANIPADAA
jgi:hypothetical protein